MKYVSRIIIVVAALCIAVYLALANQSADASIPDKYKQYSFEAVEFMKKPANARKQGFSDIDVGVIRDVTTGCEYIVIAPYQVEMKSGMGITPRLGSCPEASQQIISN